MGWAYGHNNNGREIGYGVKAICDHQGCEAKIDRGMAYLCGSEAHSFDNAGMDDEQYCGDYFCPEHLTFVPLRSDPSETIQVCVRCAADKPQPEWPEDEDDEPMSACTPTAPGSSEASEC